MKYGELKKKLGISSVVPTGRTMNTGNKKDKPSGYVCKITERDIRNMSISLRDELMQNTQRMSGYMNLTR